MEATRSRNIVCGSKLGAPLALLCGLAFIVGNSRVGQADVRNAVKQALPATVAVEWHDATVQEKPAADAQGIRTTRGNQVRMASGTIVSADGLIVTTLEGTEKGKYSVTLKDRKAFEARLLVDDRRSGLRLLKVDLADLPHVAVASEPAQIGEEVTATYCLDLRERAAVRGIVSTTGRELTGIGAGLLQLDFTVGMMSGGSPVVNERGELVGIIAIRRAGPSPTTFAVPAALVRQLVEAPRKEAPTVLQRARLGLYLTPKDPQELVIDDSGRVRARLVEGSPAAAAGMHDGDEILTIDGKQVESPQELSGLIAARVAGEKIHVTIRRDGKVQGIDVTLAPAPEENLAQGESDSSAGANSSTGTRALTTVRPESIFVFDEQGRARALNNKENEKSLGVLREFYEKAYRAQLEAGAKLSGDGRVSTPTVVVERSDVEKRLETISRDMQSLKEQMEKLTLELQRLQKQLSNAPQKPVP